MKKTIKNKTTLHVAPVQKMENQFLTEMSAINPIAVYRIETPHRLDSLPETALGEYSIVVGVDIIKQASLYATAKGLEICELDGCPAPLENLLEEYLQILRISEVA